jgi:hypothetical protein
MILLATVSMALCCCFLVLASVHKEAFSFKMSAKGWDQLEGIVNCIELKMKHSCWDGIAEGCLSDKAQETIKESM